MKSGFDLHEEEGGIAIAIGHALHHFDAVVDPLKLAGMHRPSCAS